MKNHLTNKLYIIIIFVFTINIVDAQHLPDHDHKTALHFSHPLVTESPSPDTKIRTDYLYMNLTDDDLKMHTFVFEAEYAFFRWLSLELDVPYTILSNEMTLSRLDNIDVGLKYANFAFEESGLLLGGGIELGLPTGSDEDGIGSSTVWAVEPFVDFGYKNEGFEAVGFATFGIPVDGDEEEADFEFGWNLSVLYHITNYIEGLVELSGETISGGEEDGFSTSAVIPGIKVKPVQSISLKVGFGYIIPITDEKDINNGSILSVFYHF